MIARLVRQVGLVAVGLLAADVARRTVGGRRRQRRLASPVTAWPEVPLDEPAVVAPAGPTPETDGAAPDLGRSAD